MRPTLRAMTGIEECCQVIWTIYMAVVLEDLPNGTENSQFHEGIDKDKAHDILWNCPPIVATWILNCCEILVYLVSEILTWVLAWTFLIDMSLRARLVGMAQERKWKHTRIETQPSMLSVTFTLACGYISVRPLLSWSWTCLFFFLLPSSLSHLRTPDLSSPFLYLFHLFRSTLLFSLWQLYTTGPEGCTIPPP